MDLEFYQPPIEGALNNTLVDDLETRLGVRNLLEWIEFEGDRLSSLGRVSAGHIEFLRPLLEQRNVGRIFPKRIVGYASIQPGPDERYDILYNGMLDSYRWRMSVAHEIGHTYWFAPDGKARPLSPAQISLGSDPSIEQLCDRFALALLLPRNELAKFISARLGQSPSDVPLNLISAASENFRVSERFVAQRLFFGKLSNIDAIVCLKLSKTIRKDATRVWTTSWYTDRYSQNSTVAVSGFDSAFGKTKGKAIPSEMVPSVGDSQIEKVPIDGRWRLGLKNQITKLSKRAFRNLKVETDQTAFVYKRGETIYIAFPQVSAN